MPGRIDGRDRGIDSLEVSSPQDALREFFHWTEQQHSRGAQTLVTVISGLVPQSDKPMTEGDFRNGLTDTNCTIAMNLLSAWLDEVKIGGFRKLNMFDKGGVALAKTRLKTPLPAAAAVSDPDTQAVLRAFASAMKRYDQISLTSKGAIGLLLSESIGSQLSGRGSHQLRALLEQPLQGHFDWLRNALGVRDVAQSQNFIPMDAPEPAASAPFATGDFQNETPAQRRARNERLAQRIPESSTPTPHTSALLETWFTKSEQGGDFEQAKVVYDLMEPDHQRRFKERLDKLKEKARPLPDYRSPEAVRAFFVGERGERGDRPSRLARIKTLKRYIADPGVDATPEDILEFIETARDLANAIRWCPAGIRLPFEPKVPRASLLAQLTKDIEGHEALHSMLPPR